MANIGMSHTSKRRMDFSGHLRVMAQPRVVVRSVLRRVHDAANGNGRVFALSGTADGLQVSLCESRRLAELHPLAGA